MNQNYGDNAWKSWQDFTIKKNGGFRGEDEGEL